MDGYVNSNGCKIYYQVRGQGDPLILLMGFGADGSVWENHVKVYEKHFQCIILDNRGVGKSDAPKGPYSTAMMADDAIAVLDHLKIKKAMVAGISMGGAISQSLALNHPQRISCLVLISTWPAFNNFAISLYENYKRIRRVADQGAWMELLQLWIYAPPFYENGMDELRAGQASAAANPAPQSQHGFEGQLDACIGHNVISRLHEIKVPTLITIGMLDIMTPPAFSDILHKGIKNSQIVRFPKGGHIHHFEDLERFNKVTTDFLLKCKAYP